MVAEIKGKDWNKEVVTSKDAVNGGPSDGKRTEFYEKRSDLKTADIFNDVVSDLTGKGYKTLTDLGATSKSYEIKAGNTLFPMIKDYFSILPGMTPDQAEKEAYLSLAFVMKENPGINVDDLKIGGKVTIIDGYLTVVNPDGATMTIDSVPLRPSGATVAPVVTPTPDVVPPVPSVPATPEVVVPVPVTPEPTQPPVNPEPVAPVVPVVPQDSANKEKVTPELPKVVVDPLPPVPATPVRPEVVPPVVEPVPPVVPETVTPQTGGLTLEQTKGDVVGTYTNPENGDTFVGTFEKGVFVTGIITSKEYGISSGNFDKTTGTLIQGTWTSPDGKTIETGSFSNDENNGLINGIQVKDGKITNFVNGAPLEPAPVVPPVTPEHTEAVKDEANKVVEPKPEIPAEKEQEATPLITEAQVKGNEIVTGKYTWSDDSVSVGRFKNGNQIDGSWTAADGKNVQNGTFWDSEGNGLKTGSWINPKSQENGSFNEQGELIDGVRIVDGVKEFVGLEKTVTEIQGKMTTLKLVPRKGFETNPYKSDGANIIFQNEKPWGTGWISDKPIHTVESPEKAAALVALLNVQYLPTAPVAPAEKPAPVAELANESQKTLDFVTNTLKLKEPVAVESIKSATVTIDGVVVEGNQFDYKGGKVLISKDQKGVYFDTILIDVDADDVDRQIVDILSAR